MIDSNDLARRLEILEGIPVLSHVPKKALRTIAEQTIVRTYPAGKRMIRSGDVGLGLFGILSGEVQVSVTGEDGCRVPVRRRGKGSFVGEFSLFDQSPRSADVDAITDVECIVLTKDVFDSFIKKQPEVALKIIPSLTAKVRELTERVVTYEQRIRELEGKPRRPADLDPDGYSTSTPRTGIVREAERIKDEVKDRILELVGSSYPLRLLTNTYAVVLGCPARLEIPEPAGPVWLEAAGEVKVGFLDARVRAVEVVGEGNGPFEITIFPLASQSPRRFRGTVRPGSRTRFRLGDPRGEGGSR